MGALVEDARSGAEQVARALVSTGYAADYTGRSLWEVDRFLQEQTRHGRPLPGGHLVQDFGAKVFALGGYVGEVVRRSVGGEWSADDADPQGEVSIALLLPDGTTVWPVQRVMKRIAEGDENSIGAYGAALGVPVGARPAPPSTPHSRRRRFFRRVR